MPKAAAKKPKKTFPLEIEDDLHKALKVRAIQEDKTLHTLIIETLSARMNEEPASYTAGIGRRAKP
jgi:predicted HicB family RNase H-like nuclease